MPTRKVTFAIICNCKPRCGHLFITRFYLYSAAIYFIYLHSHCLQRKLSEREAQRDSLQREKADLLQRNQQLEVDIQQQAVERVGRRIV